MGKGNKEIVRDFFTGDFINDPAFIQKYLHPEMEVFWNAKTGYTHLTYNDVVTLLKETSKSFDATRVKITHLLGSGDQVTIRFTLKVSTIERPEKMDSIAHFLTIWEIKDKKLYKGYQMTQPVEEDLDAMKSWNTN